MHARARAGEPHALEARRTAGRLSGFLIGGGSCMREHAQASAVIHKMDGRQSAKRYNVRTY